MGEAQKNEAVKYNHLDAAEMGEEQNYNQIDGVINNTKPSIIEYLRQFMPQPSRRGDKPEKSVEMGK